MLRALSMEVPLDIDIDGKRICISRVLIMVHLR